jgi:two-component system, cell cycle sensor histidine kinase and response regulator CckA
MPRAQGESPLILNVDDNDAIRRYRSALLSDAGFTVREAQDGAGALRLLGFLRPVLVILDVRMPGLDGFEVCQQIKNSPLTRHIAVLHITCEHTDPTDWARGLESGADSYLIEPVDPVVFVGVVRALVKRQAVEADVRIAEESARKALEEREQKYRDLFDNASDILYTFDTSGHVTAVNRTAEEVTGRPASEMIGRHFTECVAPEYQQVVRDRCRLEREGQRSRVMEIALLGQDGARIPVELRSRPIMRDGHLVEIQASAHDIRERKEMQSQLTRTQKLEALGRMAAGVAHDFNNVLTIIYGCSSAALETLPPDHPAHGDVQAIIDATNRATALSRQLLTFGRQRMLEPRGIALDALVTNSVSLVEHLIGPRVQLHVQLNAGDAQIFAEPSQIEQVILNLALNGRDAMPTGGDLTIGTSLIDAPSLDEEGRVGPPTRWAALTVSDTGHGIDGETMAHIFEPFFTTKPSDLGTGLGLATVYGIVTQSGGTIDVTSEPGQGTRFTIHLPVVSTLAARSGAEPAHVRLPGITLPLS